MILNRSTALLLPLIIALALLAGCWTAPVATVQPKGPPRLIQERIVVDSIAWPATVQSVDPAARVIVLQTAKDASAHEYRVSRRVTGFERVMAGEKVYAVVREELTVSVAQDNRLAGAHGTPRPFVSSAKILSLDPSYRLLTLQYPNGQSETIKVGRDVRLKQMQAGDDVGIQPLEVVAVAARKPWWKVSG